ncbi:MAG: CopG family transcriptional regulator [Burkholderiaceae bacterium]
MGQVTIYLDDQTEQMVRGAAHAEGISLSQWVARRIDGRSQSEWPAFMRDLAGAWPDLPSAEQIRKSARKDLPRRRL